MATATATKKPAKSGSNATSLAGKFQKVISELKSETVEREVEIDLLVRSVLAKGNGLLIGEPGVAKSLLIDTLMDRIDASVFTLLMAKDTPSEQVLGPVSLAALKRDEFQRITTGKLPDANLGWIDEIFKSNSTVLNACLKIINEGKFDNNGHTTILDFWSMIGASNELPGPDRSDLNAFRDRFGWTKIVNHVRTTGGLIEVIDGQLTRLRGQTVAQSKTLLTLAEMHQAQSEVAQIGVPDLFKKNAIELRTKAEGQNLKISVRRMFEGIKLCMAAAWLAGATEVSPNHLQVFEHVLWNDPEDAKTAFQLTLEFAGQVAQKAQKFRVEFEEQRKELTALQGEMPDDDSEAPTPDLMGQIGTISTKLKKIDSRIGSAIEDANEEGHDTSELAQLQVNVAAARESVKKLLGIG